MKTEKMTGFFDVRQYAKNVDREHRDMIAEGSQFTFKATFAIAELPDLFKKDGQPDVFVNIYASKSERENAQAQNRQPIADRAILTFKIGKNCRWFDKFGRETAKPTNAELDGCQYEVLIDFARKPKSPNDERAASGYWVNAIMFRRAENPFEGHSLADAGEEPDSAPVAQSQPVQQTQASATSEPKLPF